MLKICAKYLLVLAGFGLFWLVACFITNVTLEHLLPNFTSFLTYLGLCKFSPRKEFLIFQHKRLLNSGKTAKSDYTIVSK